MQRRRLEPLSPMVALDTDCSAKCSVTTALVKAGGSSPRPGAPSSFTARSRDSVYATG